MRVSQGKGHVTRACIVDPAVKTQIWAKISGSRSFPVQKILDTAGRRWGCPGTPSPARRELSTAHWHGRQWMPPAVGAVQVAVGRFCRAAGGAVAALVVLPL